MFLSGILIHKASFAPKSHLEKYYLNKIIPNFDLISNLQHEIPFIAR